MRRALAIALLVAAPCAQVDPDPAQTARDEVVATLGRVTRIHIAPRDTRGAVLLPATGIDLDFVASARGGPLPTMPEDLALTGEEIAAWTAHLQRCIRAGRALDRSWAAELPLTQFILQTADDREIKLWAGVRGMPIYREALCIGAGDPELEAAIAGALEDRAAKLRRAWGTPLDLPELRALPADLEVLHAPRLESAGARAELARFSRLQRLSMNSGTEPLPLDAISELGVESLAINGAGITAEGWAQLSRSTSLRELCLIDGAGVVPPTGWATLPSFPNLRGLRVTGAWLDDAAAAAILPTRIEHLALSGARLSPAALRQVASIPSLRTLEIERLAVFDSTHIEALRNARQLTALRLSFAAIPKDLETLDDLRKALPACEIDAPSQASGGIFGNKLRIVAPGNAK